MIIIPVIDILNGLAVHARQGERDRYQPVNSPLCRDPRPSAVIRNYLSLFPFETIYIADLNAIMHKGDNHGLITGLVRENPELYFWIDAGNQSLKFQYLEHVSPVIGTETGVSVEDLKAYQSGDRYILSLDFLNGGLIGDPALLSCREYWPDRIIIMPIDKVGSRSGPDLDLITSIQTLIPGREIYVAGGVREGDDLSKLGAMGINGVLTASALHEQKLGPDDLSSYERRAKKTPV